MSKKIDQRVAIVTGGSGGLGKAVALRLASEGTAVVVHYNRNEKKAEEIVERIRQSGGKAIAASADLTQFAQAESLVEQTVQQFGGLDILAVCSGGHDIPDEMRSLPRSERYRIWNRLVEFNMSAPMFCAYAAFPYMAKQGYGRIVFSASVAKNGLMVALDFLDEIHRCGYAASKEGLVGMTYTLANYLARYNITVNCVVPGRIMESPSELDFAREKQSLILPLGRIGSTAEVADVIVFFASEKASYTTGNVVYASGGWTGGGFSPVLVDWLATNASTEAVAPLMKGAGSKTTS